MGKFWDYDNRELHIENTYKGQSAFLVVGGPSLNKLDLSLLDVPGIITMGVNNSPKIYRPDLWISVDSPSNFMISIWQDPKIKKFIMHGKRNKLLWDNNNWCPSDLIVANCPNIIYYKDNEHFKPTGDYLDEDTINWGNHTNRCECGIMREDKKLSTCPVCGLKQFGCRSVMLAAIKTLYVLGFNKVFIIGADFRMSTESRYAWHQSRTEHSAKSNNDTYERLNQRLGKLRPVFEKRGFYVFNATPDSNLTAFPKINFKDAIKIATRDFPNVKNERTFGMYERRSIDTRIEKEQKNIKHLAEKINSSNSQREKRRLKRKLERAQTKLTNALEEKEQLVTWKE